MNAAFSFPQGTHGDTANTFLKLICSAFELRSLTFDINLLLCLAPWQIFLSLNSCLHGSYDWMTTQPCFYSCINVFRRIALNLYSDAISIRKHILSVLLLYFRYLYIIQNTRQDQTCVSPSPMLLCHVTKLSKQLYLEISFHLIVFFYSLSMTNFTFSEVNK